MKTGIELIAIERQEQIEKHGFDNQYVNDHPEYYTEKQMAMAARELLQQHPSNMRFPKSWDNYGTIHRMASKSYQERLIIAGAFIAAEIDRISRYDVIFSNFGTSDETIGKCLTIDDANKLVSETNCDNYQSVRIVMSVK